MPSTSLYQIDFIPSTYSYQVHLLALCIFIPSTLYIFMPSTLYIFMPSTLYIFMPSTSLCHSYKVHPLLYNFIPSTSPRRVHLHTKYIVYIHAKYISVPCTLYIFIPSTPSSKVHIQAKYTSTAQVVGILLQGVRVVHSPQLKSVH